MGKKILLIEDDPFLSDIYITKFEQVGYDIDVANDGEKGLQMAKELKPGVILLDIVLPKMTGLEVLAEIKKDPSIKDATVIVLSNLGSSEDVERSKELGADGYLIKSQYTPSEVVSQVENIIKK